MKKFYTLLLIVITACAVNLNGQVTIEDNFDAAHDYITSGVTGTIWSGVLGINDTLPAAERENYAGMGAPSAMDSLILQAGATDGNVTGALKLSSYFSAMDERYTPFALYINVPKDQKFEASVEIVGGDYASFNGNSVNFAATGLFAEGDSGDWQSIQTFEKYNFAYLSKSFNGYAQKEDITFGTTLADTTHMKISSDGSNYVTWVSMDGANWIQVDETPVADISTTGKYIKVGICHNVYDLNTAIGYVDNFKLYLPDSVPSSVKENIATDNFKAYYQSSTSNIILSL